MNVQDIVAFDKDIEETVRHAKMYREQHQDGVDKMDALGAVVANMRSLHAQMVVELDAFVGLMEAAKSGSNIAALKAAA